MYTRIVNSSLLCLASACAVLGWIMILVPLAYFIFVGRFGSAEVWQALAAAGCAWVLERNWWRSDRRVGSS